MSHRPPRGPRRMAALMLVVQLLLLLFTALPLPAPAAAGRDPAARADELGDVGDALFEQVADTDGAAAEELGREALLDVLGEHEHRRARPHCAQLDRGAQAFVGERRRHADVDDDDVRVVVLHRADGKPHVLEERVIHAAAVPGVADEDFAKTPPGDWLLQHSLWSQAEHAISAVGAQADEAELLDIAVGEPCLLVERRTWNQDRPVTAVRLLYPGPRHRFVGRFGPYGQV